MYLQFSSVSYHKKVSFIMFSTCSQSSIFQIHLCYFTLCQFFCQFTLILLYINGVCPFAFCGLSFPRTWFWAAGTSSPRLLPKHSHDRPQRNRLWHIQDSKPRRSTNKSTSPQRKRAHMGSFSQIVSILGEVKLVNVCIGALAPGGQVLHRSRHLGLPK